MGQKVSPISFRLGKGVDWQSKWFAKKGYHQFLLEDIAIRNYIIQKLAQCWVSKVDIKREKNVLEVTIHTVRPGMIIGRAGTGINALIKELSKLIKKDGAKELKINIEEIKEPNLDAYLVAYNIAERIKKRVSYKRTMRQAISRSMEAGAKGIKVVCKGRLAGVEIARAESMQTGTLPLGTINVNIDYGQTEAKTTYGLIGVKVWINKS